MAEKAKTPCKQYREFFRKVRMKGLEPPRLTAPDPKSGVATNYTTSAGCFLCKELIPFYSYKYKTFCFKIRTKKT